MLVESNMSTRNSIWYFVCVCRIPPFVHIHSLRLFTK